MMIRFENDRFHRRGRRWQLSCLLFLTLHPRESESFVSWKRPLKPSYFARPITFAATSPQADAVAEPSTDATTENGNGRVISGLLPPKEFSRLNQIDETLRNLQSQLDTILTKPLSDVTAETLYEQGFELLGPSFQVLATSRQELVALSMTLVLATSATRQASLFISSLTGENDQNGAAAASNYIDYQLIAETATTTTTTNNWTRIGVLWKTNVTSLAAAAALASTPVTLEGMSLLELNSETGKILRHQLLHVMWNNQPLDAISEALATLRAAVRSLGQVPWLPSATSTASPFSFFTELRDSLLEQAASSTTLPSRATSDDIPLFLTNSLDALLNDTTVFNNSKQSNLTKADDLMPTGVSSILPGTLIWKQYASAHQALTTFVKETIPKLSSVNVTTASREDFRSLFTFQAQMVGIDNRTVLLEGGTRLADFYRTLSSLRRNTRSTWSLQSAHIDDWKQTRIRIQYVTTIPNPLGGGSNTKIQGTDVFVLDNNGSGRIARIEQVELVVAGNSVKDPSWFQSLIAAVETGAGSGLAVGGANWWMDIWQQAAGSAPLTKSTSGAPALSDKAAVTLYKIMASLHGQIANLETRGKGTVPLTDFLAENVELRGYLGEVLIRGKPAYLQLMGIALASLNGAIASGRVTWVKDPSSKSVELTAQGAIKCSLILPLQIKSLNENIGLPAVPLDLELVSEYRVDETTGDIIEHRLVESRVNGQLTPADVIPRWIKQWSSNTPWKAPLLDGTAAAENAVQAVLDTLSSWVQRSRSR